MVGQQPFLQPAGHVLVLRVRMRTRTRTRMWADLEVGDREDAAEPGELLNPVQSAGPAVRVSSAAQSQSCAAPAVGSDGLDSSAVSSQ
ncbi:hypothetical protein SO3561_00241 [Streptomyces olivochromogenes]|uniref:Uncharacterized protein n=1 Tax=Streptomyces olivochromogenes TaxID=1963 RepID=A0A250V465_STROL|nr:hypothetical protein SO3561_00241 [Streptomyces olivochromogenes]